MDNAGGVALAIVLVVLIVFVIIVLVRSVRIIPQARAGVVERLGKYQRTLNPGLTILIPFVDRLLPLLDLREQVVSFPPQPVITEDNLVVSIDTVVYFQVTDPRAATYEIANYIQAVEQLTTTTLRNVVGGLNLEEALTSRDQINGQLRGGHARPASASPSNPGSSGAGRWPSAQHGRPGFPNGRLPHQGRRAADR
jgi:regulator of protease activity HflC (stomatin/prohibitin superfamily)